MKRLFYLMTFVLVFLSLAGVGNAVSIPTPPIGTIESFLHDSGYFNSYEQIFPIESFTGTWQYTAIASEAANTNITEIS